MHCLRRVQSQDICDCACVQRHVETLKANHRLALGRREEGADGLQAGGCAARRHDCVRADAAGATCSCCSVALCAALDRSTAVCKERERDIAELLEMGLAKELGLKRAIAEVFTMPLPVLSLVDPPPP